MVRSARPSPAPAASPRARTDPPPALTRRPPPAARRLSPVPPARASLYSISLERGTTPAAAEKELVRRVLAHTGVRDAAAWEVTATVHAPADRARAPLTVVSMSDAPPGRRYVSGPGLVAEAGAGLGALLRKASRYEPRPQRAIRGAAFALADLQVRVGLSFDRGAPVGVVVEVEVRPCARAPACARLAEELMEKITAPLVPPPAAGHDAAANAAATTLYAFEHLKLDLEKVLPGEPLDFSFRHAALLYAKFLSS